MAEPTAAEVDALISTLISQGYLKARTKTYPDGQDDEVSMTASGRVVLAILNRMEEYRIEEQKSKGKGNVQFIRTFPDSSNVKSVAWMPDNLGEAGGDGRIIVTFKTGQAYEYEECSYAEYALIVANKSVGQAVNVVLVKTDKPYRKLPS